jgi:hypothetical protein
MLSASEPDRLQLPVCRSNPHIFSAATLRSSQGGAAGPTGRSFTGATFGVADLGKGKRTQRLPPSGSKWRDAWSGKLFDGGQTITVNAELHQIPLFVRAGSKVKLNDLNQEWKESHAIAEKKPDLKALGAELKAWFEKR